MNYDVRWSLRAEIELLAIIAVAADPAVVTAAAWSLNRKLEEDAHNLGESRDPGERIAFEEPLIALFELNIRLKTARVLHVQFLD